MYAHDLCIVRPMAEHFAESQVATFAGNSHSTKGSFTISLCHTVGIMTCNLKVGIRWGLLGNATLVCVLQEVCSTKFHKVRIAMPKKVLDMDLIWVGQFHTASLALCV